MKKAINIFFAALLLLLIYRNYSLSKGQYSVILNNISILSDKIDLIYNKVDGLLSMQKMINYKSLPIEKLSELDFIDKTTLLVGKQEMSRHKAVFTGISRDNAQYLPEVMKHIEYIGENFKDYRVIIFENDSKDATKIMLNLWKSINPKVFIISEEFHNGKRASIKFLADIRNKYLEVLKMQEYDNFDIVIPIDMDMKYGIDIRGIQDSFSNIDSWDMVCSNGIYNSKGNMYDAFAFRNEEFPDTPNEYVAKTGKQYWDTTHISDIQKIYSPNLDLVPVFSCFGGMAIYKRTLFKNCSYDSIDEDCEHVSLHQCMRRMHHARIFMNPAQIIRYAHYTN